MSETTYSESHRTVWPKGPFSFAELQDLNPHTPEFSLRCLLDSAIRQGTVEVALEPSRTAASRTLYQRPPTT